MTDISKRIHKILAAEFDVDEEVLTTDASFVEDLGADSLDMVEIAMALEKEFDIEIRDDDAEAIKTVGDAEKFITGTL